MRERAGFGSPATPTATNGNLRETVVGVKHDDELISKGLGMGISRERLRFPPGKGRGVKPLRPVLYRAIL
jgi:hypothetical protein